MRTRQHNRSLRRLVTSCHKQEAGREQDRSGTDPGNQASRPNPSEGPPPEGSTTATTNWRLSVQTEPVGDNSHSNENHVLNDVSSLSVLA